MASNKVPDLLIRENEVKQLNLSTYFGAGATGFTVTNEKGEAVAARVENGLLVLDAQELGYSDLVISGKDAGGATITENVRVRVAGENAYTIAVLPDTQDYTNAGRVSTFKGMTQWLVDNKESLNIQFVTHVGDITTENGTDHWTYAKQALSILDGKIPYGLTLGNHDGVSGSYYSSRINDYFSIDQLKAANGEHFGGVYDQQPTLSNNSYSTFTAPDGTKWLVLNLEFGAREDVVRWAGEVIEGHLDHRVILTTHSYMNWAGRHDATGAPLYDEGTGYDYGLGNSAERATDGEMMYRELVQKYSNVTFTFSGHIFGDGAETLVSYDQFGNPVYQMMVNYQNGVSSEITGNAGGGSGSAGGNGAIRLVTIDPENDAFYTSTYFSLLDDYSADNRTKEELDRNGLTGPYRGQEETYTGIDLGTPNTVAIAKAGNDKFVSAANGADKAEVTLDGDWTLNPSNDQHLTYVWTDRQGNVVATEATPTLSLGAGQHRLTLTVTDGDGRASADEVLVVVSTDDTLLVDNFNDGNANGWGREGPAIAVATGTTSSFKLPALPGGNTQPQPPADTEDAPVTYIPKVSGTTNGIPLKIENGGTVKSYSLVYDILVPAATAGGYTALLQTSAGGNADAELFIRKSGTVGGIGTNGDYEGTFSYDTWHRVAFTFTDQGSSTLIKKYIDGVYVGDTVQSGGNYARYTLDLNNGFYLFADNDGETSPLYASSVLFTDKVFTDAEIEALGGVTAGGIVDTLPAGKSVQLDFSTNAIATAFGQGSSVKKASEFTIPELPAGQGEPGPELPGTDAAVSFIPKLSQGQGVLVKPAQALPEGTVVTSYSLVYDLLIPSGGSWFSFLQTDVTNGSDAELFLKFGSGIGINGDYEGGFTFNEWHRVAFTIENEGSQTRIKKYIDGNYVGDTVQSGGNHGRYAIDLSKGLLLFADENGETANAYVSSVLMTDKIFTAGEIGALGGAKAGGIVSAKPSDFSIQIDFSTPAWNDDFGNGIATATTIGSNAGNFRVKGSVASRADAADGQAAPEGRLFEQSDSADNIIVWNDAAAKGWKNYVFESTLQTTDNDGIGVVFYYTDAKNHYRVVFDAETNSRSLVKVKDGVETVLASEHGGTPWTRDFQVKVAVTGNEIRVFLDDRDLFGVVKDSAPFTGGTVGFFSDNQRSSQFDNVTVNAVTLTAHAGDDARAFDADGNGKEWVSLSAKGAYGLSDIVSYLWTNEKGEIVAGGETAAVELATGQHKLTLTVQDRAGNSSTDTVKVDVVGGDRLLLAEDFSTQNATTAWTIVDEGEFGGVGLDGKSSQWELRDGAFVQLSNLSSRQLTWNGASNGDPWKKGWSPHGDGVNVLRKGTYALYNDADAKEWSDYAVQATIKSPDNGALGLLVYYQDANNYYKVELDANGDYDRSPSNGAGSLFQLIQVKDGVEKYLNQFPAKYTPNEAFTLRVEVLDNKIQAYVNGDALFAYAIEDRAQTKGTIGLFSWDSAGVSFDDIRVEKLEGQAPADTTPPTIAGIRALTDDVGADTVVFEVTFDEAVKDVDAADFALIATGLKDGYAIDKVEGEGSTWTVTVTGVVGRGSLALALAQDVAITDAAGNALAWSDVSAAHQVLSPYEIVKNQFGGNDIYLYDADSLVADLGTNAIDRVFYDGEKATVVLPDNIEQGTLLDAAKDSNLFGGAGDNTLTGNAFDNVIRGGAGRDVMTGGKGADTFLFDAADQSGARQIDLVTDFNIGEGDKLAFDGLGVHQQASGRGTSQAFTNGVLTNTISNMLSSLTNDVALATTYVASVMGQNSVAAFRFDDNWYVVQTGDRTGNINGLSNALTMLNPTGLRTVSNMAEGNLSIENVVELDLVGTTA
ncbi:family 16 glycoside hydrolase, partial [Pseudochelatococcus lubricantis]|uniref:family 16 glycoside hydrolase n=1 Tax=Pseudochelatococcus lubricantis TaxID=1538102 RepID=UPI0035E7C7D7